MANIKDIAKHAGVSVTTVSRTFNNRGYISKETRLKIEQACTELNYQPNEIARSLLKKTSHNIGVLVPRLDSFFFSELLQHLESELFSKGYRMMICATNGDEKKEKSYLDMFRAQNVDGIIIASYLSQKTYDYSKLGIPAVAFDRYIEGGITCIGSNHYKMGELATKRLIKAGCKNLVHFSGDVNVVGPFHDRTRAFTDLCEINGIQCNVFEKKLYLRMEEFFIKTINILNEKNPQYDGLFINDYDACIYLQYAREHGIVVPNDVQIVGFDGLTIGRLSVPQITTVAQSFEKLSFKMVNTLIKIIKNKNNVDFVMDEVEQVDVELLERGTTK